MMAVIFQLFSVGDLQKLTPVQLHEELIPMITRLLQAPEVREQVKPRAYQVFRQLVARDETQSIQRPAPDSSLPLIQQLFKEADLALLNQQQRTILEWAIACEVTYSPYVLQAIRHRVYAWFYRQTQTKPAPDVPYSPFSLNYKAVQAINPPEDFSLPDKRAMGYF